jgi:WD40 repeat protein
MTDEPRIDTGTVDAENPWPGLASFREADRALFFGRETESEELFRLVLRERLTVLFGLSGLGKTSLLQAGLFPRLRDENVLPVLIRIDYSAGSPPPSEQILAALARGCQAAGAEMPAVRPGETLWELFHRQGNEFWSARNRPLTPLLVFDQFEEIFTLGNGRPETAELLAVLTSLTEGAPPPAVKARLDENPAEAKEFSFGRHSYKILLSLREDFLPELETLRNRMRTIGNNRMRVRRMTGENALRVVLLPGRGLVEPDVAEKVVRFVAGESGEDPDAEPAPLSDLEIEPALLSIVCRELNNKRRANGEARITAGLLEGSRTEILTDLYERSLADLGPEVRTFIEERLLTVSGFRDSVALENALATPGVTRAAIDRLTERRLLRIEDRGNGQRIELTHDVLTGVVRQSRDTRRQGEERERAEAAMREAEERERKIRRDLRRSRQGLAAVAVLLVFVAVLSVFAYRAKWTIKQILSDSEVERAFNLEDTQPQEALACLARALEQDPDNPSAFGLALDLLLNRSWMLPERAINVPDAVTITLSPDDRTAAVIGVNGEVRLLDLATFKPTGAVLREETPIEEVRYSLDGRRIISLTETTGVVWDAQTGRKIGGPFEEVSGGFHCLGPHCDLLQEIRGSQNHILDAASGAEIGSPVPASIPFDSPDGARIARIVKNGAGWAVAVQDVRSGVTLGPLMPAGEEAPLYDARISPDGTRIAGRLATDVLLWDSTTHQRLPELPHEAQIRQMKFGPGGQLLTYADDGFTRVWDTRSGDLLARIELDAPPRSLELSPDGRTLATVSEDRTARLWDAATGKPLAEPVHDVEEVNLLTGGPGLRLVTASEDGDLHLLRPSRPAEATVLQAAPGGVFDSVAFGPEGRLFAVVEKGVLSVYETATGKSVGVPQTGLDNVRRIHFVADGRLVAVIRTAEVSTWDFTAGRIAGRAPLQAWAAYASVSPDGTKAAAFERNDAPVPDFLRVVDLATGQPLTGALPYHVARSWGPPPFSPDGELLLLAPDDYTARVVEAATGKKVADLYHKGRILKAGFGPASRSVLTITDDRTAHLWLAESGRAIKIFKSQHGLSSANLADGGRRVVTQAEDTRVRVWDTETGKPLGESLFIPGLKTAQLAPDGRILLVQGADWIRLWDATTGRPLGNAVRPEGNLQAVHFTQEGRSIAAATDRALLLWDLPAGPGLDPALLVRWVQAVGGYTLDGKGSPVSLPNLPARLEALRRETADAPLGQPGLRSLIHWFFTDPGKRPPRPLAAG